MTESTGHNKMEKGSKHKKGKNINQFWLLAHASLKNVSIKM